MEGGKGKEKEGRGEEGSDSDPTRHTGVLHTLARFFPLALFGKSRFSSEMLWSQYAAVFSLISSMFRNAPCPGPYSGPDVVPRTIRGDTLVTMS